MLFGLAAFVETMKVPVAVTGEPIRQLWFCFGLGQSTFAVLVLNG